MFGRRRIFLTWKIRKNKVFFVGRLKIAGLISLVFGFGEGKSRVGFGADGAGRDEVGGFSAARCPCGLVFVCEVLGFRFFAKRFFLGTLSRGSTSTRPFSETMFG